MSISVFKVIAARWEKNVVGNLPAYSNHSDPDEKPREMVVLGDPLDEDRVSSPERHPFLLVVHDYLTKKCGLQEAYPITGTDRKITLMAVLETHLFDSDNTLLKAGLSTNLKQLFSKISTIGIKDLTLQKLQEIGKKELGKIVIEFTAFGGSSRTSDSGYFESEAESESENEEVINNFSDRRKVSVLQVQQCQGLYELMIMQNPEEVGPKFIKQFCEILQEQICPTFPVFKTFLSPINSKSKGDIYRVISELCESLTRNNLELLTGIVEIAKGFQEKLSPTKHDTAWGSTLNAFISFLNPEYRPMLLHEPDSTSSVKIKNQEFGSNVKVRKIEVPRESTMEGVLNLDEPSLF